MRAIIRPLLTIAACVGIATIVVAAPEGPPPIKHRVAGAQIPVVRDVSANVAAIKRAITFAAAQKADILLTPEGALSGYVHDFNQAVVARAVDEVVANAREARLALALGVCFEEAEDHERYDEIRFYDKDGSFAGFHAKILLCRKMSAPPDAPGEIDYFRSKPLRVYQFNSLPGLTFGGLICNDLWANPEWTPQADPHLTQQLARRAARVIFQSVNSGLGEGDELLLNRQFHDANLRIRARSGHQWIVMADACDPASHRANQCQSGVLDPTGNWVVKASSVGEQMFAQTIELADLATLNNEIKNAASPTVDTVRFFVDPRTNSDDPDHHMAYGLNVTPPWSEGGSIFINLPEHLEYMPGTRGIARHHDKRPNVWQVSPDGSGAAYTAESLTEPGVFWGVRARAVKDRALFEMSITNRSAKVLKSIRPLLCFQYHSLAGFPSADSDNFAHTYVVIDRKPESVASLKVKRPQARARMAQVKDCPDEHNWWAHEMGGMIDERLDRALTVLTDRADERKVVLIWEPGKNLLCNQEIPCFHADPCIGDLGPGEARTVQGQLVFTHAPLDAVVREFTTTSLAAEETPDAVRAGLRQFFAKTARPDGSFANGIDPDYRGMSDSAYSDLAAVTYAVTLHKTFGWKLPFEERTIGLLLERQRPSGDFFNVAGTVDPASAEGRVYNTTQGIVTLHALGRKPRYPPLGVFEEILRADYKTLPPYSTSFFPLAYLASGEPIPAEADLRIRATMMQAADGYLNNHVAATFHAAHYHRLIGQPVPMATPMVARTLRDQHANGSWLLNPPARDRHATFDAVFILWQLGQGHADCLQAIQRAERWVLSCRNADGGFGHFPGSPSDADANYFQAGVLVMSGFLKPVDPLPKDAPLLSWGHLMPLP